MFPQSVWTEFRGNVHTRLKKLAGGAADASVLSQAGLLRLGIGSFEGVEFRVLKLDLCVPAVGQGIIALQCRSADAPALRPLTHGRTNEAFALERKFLSSLGGGCQSAYAANFDGFRKIEFPENSGLGERLSEVGKLAAGLAGEASGARG